MAVVRYQVDEIPDLYMHAFTPMPGLSPAGSSHGIIRVFGSPGTTKVPSPPPAFSGRMSCSPLWRSPSDVAPDWFAPQLWLADITNLGPPVHYLPNRSGVPAPVGTVGGVSEVAMGGRKVGGRRSMKWPRNLIRWPNLKGQSG